MSSVDNQPEGGETPDGVAKKINVSFDETNNDSVERTLEDIIDEELANESAEEPAVVIEDGPIDVQEEPVREPVRVHSEPEPVLEEIEEEKEVEETHEPVANERPIRVGKKKSGKGLIIFLIILMILIVGGFAVYYCISTGVIKSDLFGNNEPKCITQEIGSIEKPVSASSEEEEVIKVVQQIKQKIFEYKNNKDGVSYGDDLIAMTYNYGDVMYKINDETLAKLEKSYGLYVTSDTWIDEGELLSAVSSTLSELGFVDYAEGTFEMKYYINNNSGIICNQRGNCASSSWYSEENKKLALELAEAYKKKVSEPISFIYVNKDSISDSGKNKDYQAVMAGGDYAAQIFYRKKGGEWTYAYGTQNIPSCSLFDDEMKEALSGWTGASSEGKPLTCINEESNEEVEV